MEYASGSDAMARVQAIDMELECYERMKDPAYKANITEYGHQYYGELAAERAALIAKYIN
jgi:hypothetical protein